MGRASFPEGVAPLGDDIPAFVISVAAQLAGMHAQTLRQYDRLGLVSPSRTPGGGRRYSARDVAQLREVQRLSQEEGVSLPGIALILRLEGEADALRLRVAELAADLDRLRALASAAVPGARVFTVSTSGDVYAARPGERPRPTGGGSVTLWRAPVDRNAPVDRTASVD